jgi:hypothetical protein
VSAEKIIPTEEDKRAAATLVKESDRGCAILGAGLLADGLEQLILAFCRQAPKDVRSAVAPLFRGYAPLATLSARTQVAFALGILPRDLRDKIEIVRKLRNEFAHEWGPIDFEDQRIGSILALLIGKLKEGDLPEDDPVSTAGRTTFGPGVTKQQIMKRLLFGFCVVRISARLNFLAGLAREGRDIRTLVRFGEAQDASH